MSEEKRKRRPNWLMSEKELLVDIVEHHFSVVENKRTDTASIKKKNAEWELIAQKYNRKTTHTARAGQNLKAEWESLKKTSKKDEATYQRQILAGEVPAFRKDDPLRTRIIQMLISGGMEKQLGHGNVLSEAAMSFVITEDSDPLTNSRTDDPGEDSDRNDAIESKEQEQTIPIVLLKNEEVCPPDSKAYVIKDWNDCTSQLQTYNSKDTGWQSEKTEHERQHSEAANQGETIRQNIKCRTPSRLLKRHANGVNDPLDINQVKDIKPKTTPSTKETHKETLNDLEIQLKREILKQEKIKTRLLLLELRLAKRKLNCTPQLQ